MTIYLVFVRISKVQENMTDWLLWDGVHQTCYNLQLPLQNTLQSREYLTGRTSCPSWRSVTRQRIYSSHNPVQPGIPTKPETQRQNSDTPIECTVQLETGQSDGVKHLGTWFIFFGLDWVDQRALARCGSALIDFLRDVWKLAPLEPPSFCTWDVARVTATGIHVLRDIYVKRLEFS